MDVLRNIELVRRQVGIQKIKGARIGFVPTMGFLHEGHLSLIRAAKKESDYVVLSIFLNPLQFGEDEDLESYPCDLGADLQKADAAGVDLVFIPAARMIYPDGYATFVEVTGLTEGLCGAFRKGHFRGVTTVVTKLLNIVLPDFLYLGQKDAQQARVICKMISDLNIDTTVKVRPTVRESDGLAMSSRNSYLSPAEREAATVLYRSIQKGVALIKKGVRSPAEIKKVIGENISKEPLAKVEYVACVDWETLKNVDRLKGEIILAAAVIIGEVRLIDNIVVEVC